MANRFPATSFHHSSQPSKLTHNSKKKVLLEAAGREKCDTVRDLVKGSSAPRHRGNSLLPLEWAHAVAARSNSSKMTRRGVVAIMIASVAVVVLAWQPWRTCSSAERAVLFEFPQYAPIGQGPERDEGGGCAVFYDTRDKPDSVRAYLIGQLTSHGWKIQPSDASHPAPGFSAMRGSFMYSVSAAARDGASRSNGQQTPTSDTHVAIHVQDGVMLVDARVDVEVSSAATLDQTREKVLAVGAALEHDPAWSPIMLAPLSLSVESSAPAHQFAVRAQTRTLPLEQRKVMEEMGRRLKDAFP